MIRTLEWKNWSYCISVCVCVCVFQYYYFMHVTFRKQTKQCCAYVINSLFSPKKNTHKIIVNNQIDTKKIWVADRHMPYNRQTIAIKSYLFIMYEYVDDSTKKLSWIFKKNCKMYKFPKKNCGRFRNPFFMR